MPDIAKATSRTTEPESVSQPVQHPPPSVESLDAALTAARRIGGQQSHVTKLLQQFRKLLVEEGEASEILGLESRVKEAHRKCLDAVQEFCGSLDRDSEQYKRYMDQLQVRNREIQEMDQLVNVYILKELNMGSSRSSKSSRSSRSKSNRSTGKSSTHVSTALSDAARVRMDIKLAEINLAKVKRNKALKAEAERTKVEAESQRAILEAETDLAMARVRSEAVQGLLDLEDEELLSVHERVSQYVASLPQTQGVAESVPPLQSSSLAENEPLDCANPAVTVESKIATVPEVTRPISQPLNVQASP